MQAAELPGLHKRAPQVQLRERINDNKMIMKEDLFAKKKQKLLQAEQPRAFACVA